MRRLFSFSLPFRFLRGSYRRLSLSVVALALGVALVCALDLINSAVLRAFVEVLDTMAGRAALQVTNGQAGLFPEDVAETIARVPGVELAVPVVAATAFLVDRPSELLTVHGVDVTNDAAIRVYESRDTRGLRMDDPLGFLNQRDSIAITRVFAEHAHLGIGDTLTLETTAGRRVFTVRGLLEPQGVARVYGGRLIVMDLFAAESAFTAPGLINRVDVVVDRDAAVDVAAGDIRRALPEGFQVAAPAQRTADLHKAMQSFQTFLRGVALVSLVAAFFITFNRLATVFDARTWQLGVMRAIGMSGNTLWQELIKESLVIGAAGVAVGIPLGCALGYVLLPVIASTTALNYKLINPDAGFSIYPSALVTATVLGLLAALLAAVFPAWHAAGSALADLMRRRGLDNTETHSGAMWTTRGLVAAGTIAALLLQSAYRSPTWGLAATALLAMGAALAARPLLVMLSAPIEALLRWILPGTGQFATRSIVANPRRAGLIVATLAVGMGLVIWIWIVASSFEQSVVTALGNAFRANLVLSSSKLVSGFDDEPISGTVVGDVQQLPNVNEAIGERIRDWIYQDKAIAIDAFDPAYFDTEAFGRWQILGESMDDLWPAIARGDAVIVSSSFSHNFGVRIGERITLETPNGPLTVQVGGITSAFASPNGTIEMSRAVFQRYWNDASITRVHLRIAPGSETAVRERIAETFQGRYQFRILSAGELLTYWSDQVRAAFAGLHVIGVVVLIVILVGMADTLAAGISERQRELGIMRAVGMRRRGVATVVIAEALVLGIVGLALALLLGLAEGWLWVDATLPLLLGWVLTLQVPYSLALGIGVVTLAACFVSALLPARSATRIDPAVALRYE